jgi:hypothetical protein
MLSNRTIRTRRHYEKELQKESLKQLLLAQKVQLLKNGKTRRQEQSCGGAAELAPQNNPMRKHHRTDTAFALQEHDIEELEATEWH